MGATPHNVEPSVGRRLVARLLSFPDPVNEVSARLVAGGAALMALVCVATGERWLTAVIAYGFVARVLTGPTLSPLAQIVTRLITPRLHVAPRPVPGPPKRFAQGMGAVMSSVAAVLALGLGLGTAADVILLLLVAAASLEAIFAFCLGCKVFAALMRAGVIPQDVCERCNDLWGERARARAGEPPVEMTRPRRPRRWPLAALAIMGAGLAIAPVAFRMFDRAPKGATMLGEFRPYMTEARLDGFRRDISDIDEAVAQTATAVAAHLTATGHERGVWFTTRFSGFGDFQRAWGPIRSDMTDLLDTIRANLGNYRAAAALPSFRVFPWLFVVPGALLALFALASLVRPRWWAASRWALVALAVGLVLVPVGLRMFERASAGGRMVDAFRTIETRQRVEAMQGYFASMAVGEGAIRLEIVPALRGSGLSSADISRRFPAVSRLERRWVPILGDMTPMIGAMSDNVANYQAVAALPPFALFPWFFVLPGMAGLGLTLAAGARRGRRARASSGAAVPGPTRPV